MARNSYLPGDETAKKNPENYQNTVISVNLVEKIYNNMKLYLGEK